MLSVILGAIAVACMAGIVLPKARPFGGYQLGLTQFVLYVACWAFAGAAMGAYFGHPWIAAAIGGGFQLPLFITALLADHEHEPLKANLTPPHVAFPKQRGSR